MGGGLNPPPMGKFHNKSVPDLSMMNNNNSVGLTPSSSSGVGGGLSSISRSSSNYLDPGNLMMAGGEHRRHSTSGLPGYNPALGHTNYVPNYGHNNYSQRPEDILNSYENVEKNELVTRSKRMAIYAEDMFDFTRGQGRVKSLFGSGQQGGWILLYIKTVSRDVSWQKNKSFQKKPSFIWISKKPN